MILVIGATGMVGEEICRLLSAEGKRVRAISRAVSDPEKIASLKEMRVELIHGDLRNPSTYTKALLGVEVVISTVSSMPFSYVPGANDIRTVDFEGMKNFIDRAKNSGVQHFIYTSFSKNIDLDFPLGNAKRQVEEHLKNIGMSYTILRPSYFMEAWLSPIVGFDIGNAQINLCGDGTKKVSYISYLDVAKFAAMSVDNPKAINAEFELGGPEGVSQLEAVKIFEELTGNEFEIRLTPVEFLQKQQAEATDPMQESLFGLMRCVANGDLIDMEETLKIFPIELISVRAFAKGLLENKAIPQL